MTDESKDYSPWMTVPQAARWIKCGPKVIYKAIASRELMAVKSGLKWMTRVEWVDAWMMASATGGPESAPRESGPRRMM